MNCGYNYTGCGCNSYSPWNFNPFGCGGCNSCGNWNTMSGGCFTGCGCNNGVNWFAIVLVIFILLILCGCNRIHG